MEVKQINFLDFIGGNKRTFNIPVYQRNYEWKKEQCERLFNDIEEIANKKFEIEHFIGTIVYADFRSERNFNEFMLIDGQQRVTSLTLLLKALYDAIDDNSIKEEILEDYLTNRRASDKYRIKLKPIESDSKVFETIINDDELNDSNSDSHILKNYNFFKKCIEESNQAPEKIFEAISKINLVYISLEKDKKSENPQLIFESLNSTGLSLTQADLIRNFLLMNHDYETQTKLYKHYWLEIEKLITNSKIADFARDYLTLKTNFISKKENVYEDFKRYVHNESITEENILNDLLHYSKYYSWFLDYNSEYDEINNYLEQISQIKSTVTYPALLYLFDICFDKNEINVEDLGKILKTIMTFIVRRIICNLSTNALNKIFASFKNDVSKNEKKFYTDKIVDVLANKSGEGHFPRDIEFKNSFQAFDFTNSRNKDIILCQLESCKPNDINIEYIIPKELGIDWKMYLGTNYQSIHDKYFNTIGNITLVESDIMEKVKKFNEKEFNDKKNVLSLSNLFINEDLCMINKFDEGAIKNRIEKLSEKACDIWALPNEYNLKNEVTPDYDIPINVMNEDVDVKGKKPVELVIMNESYPVTNWNDIIEKLSDTFYDLDKEIFRKFANKNDFKNSKGKIIISDNEDEIRRPYKIAENLFIETNFSANDTLKWSRKIIKQYDGFEDDVYFKIKES